jgi:hypothetical protein
MGTEITLLFIPMPLLFLGWNIKQLMKPATRIKGAVLLSLGLAWLAYMCLPLVSKQYFIQGLAFGGFFYGPLYLVAWSLVTFAISFAKRKEEVSSDT